MPTFIQTIRPTSFGVFDAEAAFQNDADCMHTFVKTRLGDSVLSVELTKKQIWTCFEEATLTYSRYVHELNIKSNLVNVLGQPTGSSYTNKYVMPSLEYLMRLADPYASQADVGGSYNGMLGYINLTPGKQDYDVYTELMSDTVSGSTVFDALPSGSKGKMRIAEVFHFEPSAAQQSLINASNMTNFLATNMNYESYVNSTIFYVVPVFEDVLRRGALEHAMRVRRSHYSWKMLGTKLRIFPVPGGLYSKQKLFIKVVPRQDPLNPAFQDDSISGVSGPHNMPLSIIPYTSITEPGKQWIRQYTLALCTEVLGRVRSKMKTIPIPNADLTLDGDTLLSHAREDKDKLITQLQEFLGTLTNEKLMEQQSNLATYLNKQLKFIPIPCGRTISMA